MTTNMLNKNKLPYILSFKSLTFQIIVWLTLLSSGASWDIFTQHQSNEMYLLSVYLLKGQGLLKIPGPASVSCHRGSVDAGKSLAQSVWLK